MAKIGEGHLAAMGRLGLKELRNAANPSRDSIAADELGLVGNATPGQIDKGIEGEGTEQKQEPMSLDALRSTAKEMQQENQGHGLPDQAKTRDGIER